MSISICGDIGSGKSTVASYLATRLGYKVIDSGDLYRQYAATQSMDVLQLNNSGDRNIDRMIDENIKKLSRNHNDLIFVSRTAWDLVPDVFSVYLCVNPVTAAERILKSKRKSENHDTVEGILEFNAERTASELRRYEDMYGWTETDRWNSVNLIIYVGTRSVIDVAEVILSAYKEGVERAIWVDPNELLPSKNVSEFDEFTVEDYVEYLDSRENLGLLRTDYTDGVFTVVDGHNRAVAYCRKQTKFVPVLCTLGERAHLVLDKQQYYDYERYAKVNLNPVLSWLDHKAAQ